MYLYQFLHKYGIDTYFVATTYIYVATLFLLLSASFVVFANKAQGCCDYQHPQLIAKSSAFALIDADIITDIRVDFNITHWPPLRQHIVFLATAVRYNFSMKFWYN